MTFVEINDIEALQKAFDDNVCAIIIECVQGIGGINETNDAFIQTAYALCKKHKAIFIADEVQSGYGRTGDFFAFQQHNIKPDIITIAKGMGNGFPIGGVLVSDTFEAKYGMLGTTFGGNHLACAAGLAVLEIIERENLLQNSQKMGQYLINRAAKLKGIKNVKGRGLMIGLEFDSPIAELRKKLIFEEHIFTGSASNKNVLRLLPPLNITIDQIDQFIYSIDKTINTQCLLTI